MKSILEDRVGNIKYVTICLNRVIFPYTVASYSYYKILFHIGRHKKERRNYFNKIFMFYVR